MVDFATHQDKIAFISTVPTDKIASIHQGTIAMESAAAFQSKYKATSAGASLSGKRLLQMIWSNDGGTSWQDGDSRINVYSGGDLQYYYTVTCYSTPSDIFVAYNNNGFNGAAPARDILFKVFVFEPES